MPTTLDERPDTDDKYNASQQDYERKFQDLSHREQAGDNATHTNSLNDVQNNETTPTKDSNQSPWKYTNDAKNTKISGKFKAKIPVLSVGGGFGVVGILLSLVFGYAVPAYLPTALTSSAVSSNDARGSVLEKRLIAKLDQKLKHSADICDIAKAVCRAGKIPKSMLSSMEKKGITAYKGDKAVKASGDGYISAADTPTEYRFTDKTGKEVRVYADDFMKTFKNNPEFRKMIRGAYNMRYLGYSGWYMFKNFFSGFGGKKDGGVAADSDTSEKTIGEKIKKILASKLDVKDADSIKSIIRAYLEKTQKSLAEKIKRSGGSTTLLVGTTACSVVNTPRLIANAYRAIQYAQLAFALQDILLSPGDMQKAGAIDSTKIAAIGTALTERVKQDDGTISSAVDSPILQSAISVNTNKTGISKYSPGYSLLKNSLVQGSTSLSGSTKKFCNIINSPEAMVFADATDAVIGTATGGAGAVLMAALRAVAASLATIGAVDGAVEAMNKAGILDKLTNFAFDIAKGAIGNYLDGAKGGALGDALGTGIFAYFSTAATSSGAAVLKTNQVSSFSNIRSAYNNELKQEDIATLSPFDTSSQYTFLGSIMTNLALNGAKDNVVSTGLSSLGYILSAPLKLLSPSAGAADSATSDEKKCSYADSYGVESDIAVNAAGYPCAGIPVDYINMSSDEVMSYVSDDIDEDTGEIKDGTDTSSVVSDCNSVDFSSISGCTISSDNADVKKRAAQSLYQYDLQVENMFNGQDQSATDPSATSTSSTSASSSTTLVSGTAKELAQKILDSKRVNDTTGQLKEVVNGTRTNIDTNVLSVLATLSQSYSFTISSIKRDEALSVGAKNYSLHLSGHAVDIAGTPGIDGVSFGASGTNGTIQKFLNSVAAILPSNGEIGVPMDYITPTKSAVKNDGCRVFYDSGTGPHIHIGFR